MPAGVSKLLTSSAGHDGQFFLDPGARKVLLVPRHFQRVEIQELNGGNERVDALGGKFALLEHVELVLAYGLEVELLGAAVEIAGEIGDIMDIASFTIVQDRFLQSEIRGAPSYN
jgi:hypothetical protein